MDLSYLLLIAGYCILICCKHTIGHLEQNATNLEGDELHLSNKERFRRLIPYMTFYLDQGYNTQSQYIAQAPQDYQAVHNNLRPQPYYLPQYQQQKLQLVPLGYLVGGGYRRTPVYSRPSQPNYQQGAYVPQHPSDLSRMITQNYLSMVKEVRDQTKDQRPTQFTTKLEYANQNPYQNQAYKTSPSQTKVYLQSKHRFQPNHNRQPYLVKNYQQSYTSLKDQSYVQLHSNYDVNSYDTTPKVKNYEPDPNFMTITKSQEVMYPLEENSAPEPVQASMLESTQASLPQLQGDYEQSLPASLTVQSDYEPSIPAEPTEEQNNLLDILSSYQLSKVLPDKVTPSNIGYSIRTLSNILKLLEKAKSQTTGDILPTHGIDEDNYGNGVGQSFSPYQTEGSTPGRAGVDYPAYAEIPETEFTCKSQRYKGFFADPDTNCQVWHYCDLNGGQASFLCPNGTIFSQVALTCDWWFNVKCAATAQQYVLNERLYKYILPVKPSFPEDYAGPLVDQYLTLKFQELEAKKQNTTTTEKTTNTLQVLLNDEINQSVK